MILSLDTNVVIELLRATTPHYRLRLDEARADGARAIISSIVLNELAFGALRSARPELHLQRIDALVSAIEVEPWTAEDALAAARVRVELEREGKGIGAFDTLIAGQAFNRGWTVVTANVWEFLRVKGLRLLDWSNPEGVREYSDDALARQFKAGQDRD